MDRKRQTKNLTAAIKAAGVTDSKGSIMRALDDIEDRFGYLPRDPQEYCDLLAELGDEMGFDNPDWYGSVQAEHNYTPESDMPGSIRNFL